MGPPILLVHGAATTAAIWRRLVPHLSDYELRVPDRPASGDLATELEALAPHAEGAVVVGVSGGATLGLALACSPLPLAGAVLHEPAVGTLAPGLLDHVVAAYESGGVTGFARALYGPLWSPAMAPADPAAVARDLAMFRRYQPAAIPAGQGRVVTTVGADSPAQRHRAAAALRDALGVEVRVLPGCGHFAHHTAPTALAEAVRSVAESPSAA